MVPGVLWGPIDRTCFETKRVLCRAGNRQNNQGNEEADTEAMHMTIVRWSR